MRPALMPVRLGEGTGDVEPGTPIPERFRGANP